MISPEETIRELRPDELERLEPLWLALQDHHSRISPRLAGMTKRAPEQSWIRRRSKYQRWLGDPETFVLVAERDDELVGYAFVTIGPGYASWDSGDRLAELQTLSVTPAQRGHGLGSRLLGAVRQRLAAQAVAHLAVTSAVTNVDAHSFYQRHGLVTAHVILAGPTTPPEDPLAQRRRSPRGKDDVVRAPRRLRRR